MYRRTSAAFRVAGGESAGFRAWEQDGLLVTSASEPALGYLSTVSGVTPDNVHAVPDIVRRCRPLTVLVTTHLGAAADVLPAAGLTRTTDQVLALREPAGTPPDAATGPDVVPADDTETFIDVLLAGFAADGPAAAYIAAEHRSESMLRFLAVAGGEPIAAGALSVHDGVAVVGGASTMPGHRGEGGQAALLRHRLAVAAGLGCDLVVGTALADSASERNLLRAGFRVHRRSGWALPGVRPDDEPPG